MDPITLAAATVGVLAPYLGQIAGGGLARIGEVVTDGAGHRVAELYRAVRDRVTGSTYEEAVLDGAEAQPENEGRVSALQNVLAELIESDADFAASLESLVQQAQEAGARRLQVTDSGAVAGGDVNQAGTYVAGRDMHIGDA